MRDPQNKKLRISNMYPQKNQRVKVRKIDRNKRENYADALN